MAREAVLKVKEAEDKGAEIIKNAQEEARRIIAAADEEGIRQYKSAIEKARAQREELLQNAERSAEESNIPLESEGACEIAKILNPSRDKYEEAVRIVMERIVS